MNRLRMSFARVFDWFRRGRLERHLEEELETHLQMLVDEGVARGLSERESRRRARLQLGGVEQTKEAVRDQRAPWFDSVWQDMRHSWRSLRRSPGFIVVAVVLGLAVGATATLAVIVDRLVFNPLDTAAPEQLVALGGLAYDPSLGDPVEYWSRAKGLDSLALYRAGDLPVRDGDIDSWGRVAEVSGDLFRVFRKTTVSGRPLNQRDEIESLDVAVISHSFWLNHLGGRGNLLDHRVRLGGRPYTIVGVAPSGFDFPPGTQIWIPQARLESRRPELVEGAGDLAVVRRPKGFVGRIRSDATVARVRAQLEGLLRSANEQLSPRTGIRYGEMIGVSPLVASMGRAFRPVLTTLMIGAAIVLLVATTNCALFALGLNARRRTELAIRQVLGASRLRIARELMGEAVLIGIVAGLAGLLVSLGCLRVATQVLHTFGVDLVARPSTTLIASGISLLLGLFAGVLGGILPAVGVRAPAVPTSFNGVAITRFGHGDRAFRQTFAGAQIAAAVLLAAGALTTSRALINLDRVDLGRTLDDVAVVRFLMPRERLAGQDLARAQEDLIDELSGTAGVLTAAASDRLVIESRDRGFQEVRVGGESVMASTVAVAGDYFRTMGIPLVAGRVPAASDSSVVVVNETLARTLWNGHAVGQQLLIGAGPSRTVIGVVRDTRSVDDGLASVPEIYVDSHKQAPSPPGPQLHFMVMVKCSSSPRDVLAGLHAQLAREPGVTVYSASVASADVDRVEKPAQIRAALWTMYALMTIAIAIAGVSALVAYSVTLRRYELGVRLAMGSTRRQAVLLVAREGGVSAVFGILAGATLAAWLGSVLKGLLVGGDEVGLPVIAWACLAILGSSALAALLPGLCVTGNEPLELLRQ